MKVTPLPRRVDPSYDLTPVKQLLLRSCGLTFENDRERTLVGALWRRMAALAIDTPESYYTLLLQGQQELLRLIELVTVNETYFFREPEHLNLIVDTLLPRFMTSGNRRPIRILSAGCSTGEEPYSIAILLREKFGPESEQLFTITGVDIDSTAIAAAHKGEYGKLSFRGKDHSLLAHYFEARDSGRFQIIDPIRKWVGFEVVNLLSALYPQRMLLPDIILYRNVSIYFPGQVQREIFGKLAALLAEGGCLLVGASETIHHDIGILSLVKQDSLFYYCKTPTLAHEERRKTSQNPSAPGLAWSRSPQTAPEPVTRPETLRNRPRKESVQAALPDQPDSAMLVDREERFAAAILLAHETQYDKALTLLDTIIARDSACKKAYCLKGSLLLSLSKFSEAHTVCNAILSQDPLCLDAYLILGIIARQNGDVDAAFKRFREAIYLDASCWLAHFYTAEMLFAKLDGNRARSSYEATIRILEKGPVKKHEQTFFPLSFNAEQFMVICRHKLSLLAASKENG